LALRALAFYRAVVLSWLPLAVGVARFGCWLAVLAAIDLWRCASWLLALCLAVWLSWLSLTFGAARFDCWLAVLAAADLWSCVLCLAVGLSWLSLTFGPARCAVLAVTGRR
jgi:hypothetical protein